MVGTYYLTAGGVAVEVEDVDQLVLVGGGLGEHPAGCGPAAFGGVDQDGLFDAGELVEEFAHRQVQSGAVGL